MNSHYAKFLFSNFTCTFSCTQMDISTQFSSAFFHMCAKRQSYITKFKHCPAPPRGDTWHSIWANALWRWHLKPKPATGCPNRLKDHTGVDLHFCWPFSKACCSSFSVDLIHLWSINVQKSYITSFLLLCCQTGWCFILQVPSFPIIAKQGTGRFLERTLSFGNNYSENGDR